MDLIDLLTRGLPIFTPVVLLLGVIFAIVHFGWEGLMRSMGRRVEQDERAKQMREADERHRLWLIHGDLEDAEV